VWSDLIITVAGLLLNVPVTRFL